MKILHLSDLHIGKRLNEYSLLDDQKIVLDQAVKTAVENRCSAVLIAGDVYDKSSPSAEAMSVFNDFITALADKQIKVYIISGNHDNYERISYFSQLISHRGIYTAPKFSGRLFSFDTDENITIHLLPFLKPINVRPFYSDITISDYNDAIKAVIDNSEINSDRINILVAHQFITGAVTCNSEEFAVGGLDNIDYHLFDKFDYVAMGHIHRPQSCGRKEVRYAGSILKYSISEHSHKKTFTIADIRGKNDIEITEIPIELPHDVRIISGSYENIVNMDYSEDYVHIILTDENPYPDSRITIRTVFPNMLKFTIQNSKNGTETDVDVKADEIFGAKNNIEMFCEFYAFQNNNALPSKEQMKIIESIFEEAEVTE